MKTVVYQSYRTQNVAPWIQQCMQTVKSWTAKQGFDYHFIDDTLFDYVPAWYKEKVGHNILLMSDLARLEIAKELLADGYDRTIWVDADIVIFNPDNFAIDISEEYAFCREVWLAPGKYGRPITQKRINNAISVFVQGNHFLDFYSHACNSLVKHKSSVNSTDVGTVFLSTLYNALPFQLINTVGLFSPSVLQAIDGDVAHVLSGYMREVGTPLCAANLCGSLCGRPWFGATIDADLYSRIVQRLVQTTGLAINQYLGSSRLGPTGNQLCDREDEVKSIN